MHTHDIKNAKLDAHVVEDNMYTLLKEYQEEIQKQTGKIIGCRPGNYDFDLISEDGYKFPCEIIKQDNILFFRIRTHISWLEYPMIEKVQHG